MQTDDADLRAHRLAKERAAILRRLAALDVELDGVRLNGARPKPHILTLATEWTQLHARLRELDEVPDAE